MVALSHHFFFAAVQLQSTLPQNGLPTVPVILAPDSIVPLKTEV
jgi:hypothetical protein